MPVGASFGLSVLSQQSVLGFPPVRIGLIPAAAVFFFFPLCERLFRAAFEYMCVKILFQRLLTGSSASSFLWEVLPVDCPPHNEGSGVG